jgi:hypothetical protein
MSTRSANRITWRAAGIGKGAPQPAEDVDQNVVDPLEVVLEADDLLPGAGLRDRHRQVEVDVGVDPQHDVLDQDEIGIPRRFSRSASSTRPSARPRAIAAVTCRSDQGPRARDQKRRAEGSSVPLRTA